MAKFNLKIQIKAPIELRVYEIDEETYNDLGYIGDGWGDEAIKVINKSPKVASEIVVYMDRFLNSRSFSLVVKDENDNVVYETKNASKIPAFCYNSSSEYAYTYTSYEDEEYSEEDELPNFNFQDLPDGFYFAKNTYCKQTIIEGDFEAEAFDQSKFAFYPSELLDDDICEDDVFLTCIRYDGKKINFKKVYGTGYNGCEYKVIEKGHYENISDHSWHDYHYCANIK